jgi:hypothetical protein
VAQNSLSSPRPASAPDPLDVRRSVLEKKAKLLTLEAQKLALEKSMRDLRTEIAAEEKKLPKKKAATKAKPPKVTQQYSVSKAPKADHEAALARKLEAILQRLDRLEKKPPTYQPPSVPVP